MRRRERDRAAADATARGPSSVRLFVALDLPNEAREPLAAWVADACAQRDDLRPVAPEALHVTLAFIGHRPAEELEPIAAAVRESVAGLEPAELAVVGVKAVPSRRRPRLFALDLSDGEERAAAVHAAVSEALAAAGFYEPERRPFWPHVTFARVRSAAAPPIPALEAPDPPLSEPFRAGRVTLYRSHLRREGARYEALAATELAR